MITQEELKKHIHYDPFTGEFLRIGYYDGWGNYVKTGNKSENHGSVR